MTEKENELAKWIICTICDGTVPIPPLKKLKDFRVGTYLICSKCIGKITAAVVNEIIEDTGVPKTFRSMFERYLKWEDERRKDEAFSETHKGKREDTGG